MNETETLTREETPMTDRDPFETLRENPFEETPRETWERENRRAYREAEHFGDQETLNRLDAEWNSFDEEEAR
jgi:hypothetical protein